jgi:hypothetical protein
MTALTACAKSSSVMRRAPVRRSDRRCAVRPGAQERAGSGHRARAPGNEPIPDDVLKRGGDLRVESLLAFGGAAPGARAINVDAEVPS